MSIITTVSSSQVAVAGTWNAKFHSSKGAKKFKDRYQDAIEEVNSLLASLSSYQCSLVIEQIKTSREKNALVSEQVHVHTMSSLASRKVFANNVYEKVQVAITIMNYYLETTTTDEEKMAAHRRDELLKELHRIDEFLGNSNVIDVSWADSVPLIGTPKVTYEIDIYCYEKPFRELEVLMARGMNYKVDILNYYPEWVNKNDNSGYFTSFNSREDFELYLKMMKEFMDTITSSASKIYTKNKNKKFKDDFEYEQSQNDWRDKINSRLRLVAKKYKGKS